MSSLIIPSLSTTRGHFFVPYGIPISLAVGISVLVPVRKTAHAHVHDVKITELSNFVRVESFDDEPTVVTVRIQCRPRTLGRHDVLVQLLCEDASGTFSYDLIVVFNAVESTMQSCIDYLYFGEECVQGFQICPYILHCLNKESEFTLTNSNEQNYTFQCVSNERRVLFNPDRGRVKHKSSLTIKITLTCTDLTGIIPMTICLSRAQDSPANEMEELLAYHSSVAVVSTPAKVRIPTLRARESVTLASTDCSKQLSKPSNESFFEYSLTHKPNHCLQDITITLFGYLPEPTCTDKVITRNYLTQLEK